MNELLKKRAEAIDQAAAVKKKAEDEDRELTAEELAEIRGHMDEVKRLDEEIKTQEENDALLLDLEEAQASLKSPGGNASRRRPSR